MQKNNYQNILYFIAVVILITLGIQAYWNFKNYQTGKQQLINKVQISLDNAVDQYYENLTHQNIIQIKSDSSSLNNFLKKSDPPTLLNKIDSGKVDFKNFTSFDSLHQDTISVFQKKSVDNTGRKKKPAFDSIYSSTAISSDTIIKEILRIEEKGIFRQITSKVIISIGKESIKLPILDSIFLIELDRKKIDIDYGITFLDKKKASFSIYDPIIKKSDLQTNTTSSYLPKGSSLTVFFTNSTKTILKKNLFGILLSFVLIGAVIACLLYLLKIIKYQKHLAEAKNDLISNITHEFKTPIATISAALEGIQVFNTANDPKKTNAYVNISSTQLNKLNTMVEKILETTTLNSEELQLELEDVNLVDLIITVVTKHQRNSPQKELTLTNSQENICKAVDVFHFENAINNIIDNAIKYGGNIIQVRICTIKTDIIIEIQDNGASLTKAHKEKIFEKFYRVPKGNTHDIKGFGIGLFYTKTIIHKHQGTILLLLDNYQTNFKITIPND